MITNFRNCSFDFLDFSAVFDKDFLNVRREVSCEFFKTVFKVDFNTFNYCTIELFMISCLLTAFGAPSAATAATLFETLPSARLYVGRPSAAVLRSRSRA